MYNPPRFRKQWLYPRRHQAREAVLVPLSSWSHSGASVPIPCTLMLHPVNLVLWPWLFPNSLTFVHRFPGRCILPSFNYWHFRTSDLFLHLISFKKAFRSGSPAISFPSKMLSLSCPKMLTAVCLATLASQLQLDDMEVGKESALLIIAPTCRRYSIFISRITEFNKGTVNLIGQGLIHWQIGSMPRDIRFRGENQL